MANWASPLLTTQYDVFLAEMKDRDVDGGTLCLNPPTNPPVGMVRFNRTTKIFEEWSGTAWVALVIGVAGGGTGGNNQGSAVAGLGLGTMSVQNSNAVNISGGIINTITAFGPSCSLIPNTHNTYDVGSFAKQWRNGYYSSALVIPVGVDKYATS